MQEITSTYLRQNKKKEKRGKYIYNKVGKTRENKEDDYL